MSLDPEDEMQAAEFALGTLEPGERATLAARRLREPDLAAAIGEWEHRLSPLVDAAPEVEPPRELFADIETRVHGHRRSKRAVATTTPNGGGDAEELQIQLRRWRGTAVAASIVLALVLSGFAFREVTRDGAPRQFVAVLQKSADAPAFAVSINLDTREFTVRPVAAPAPAGKSYELWLIEASLGAPRSLGIIDAASVTRAGRLQGYDRAVVADATYAVTLEPRGGSPTGAPSGAPVFVGKLIPVDP